MSPEITQYIGSYEILDIKNEGGMATVTLKDYDSETYTTHESMIAKMISDKPNPSATSPHELRIALVAMEIEEMITAAEYDFTLQDVKTLCHYLDVGIENNYKECVSRMFDVKNPVLTPLASIHAVLESYRK